MNFSLKLKELREDKGLSQANLAHELNVSVGCVGMWESTKQIPPASRLVQIADFFNVTVDELIGRKTENSLRAYDHHELTDQQTIDLVKLYKALSDYNKAVVFGYVTRLIEESGLSVNSVNFGSLCRKPFITSR